MKILHISSALSWRGGEQQLFNLCTTLNSVNVNQIVACPFDSILYKRITQKNIPTYGFKKRSGLLLGLALKLNKLCKNNDIDIIHVHDSHAHTAAYLAAILGNNTKIVVSRRVDFSIGKHFLSKYKYNHKNIKKIICVSDAIKNVMKTAVKNKNVLCTIHSGINMNRFPSHNKTYKLHQICHYSKEHIVIGNTSALADHKDYFTYIDTAELILKEVSEARFVIIGGGNQKEEIQNYITDKNLQNYITLLGYRSDVPDLLPDFDIFLITSKTEGLGTSILDAFACKVPVVATKAGGIPEIVINNQTGMLASVGNATELAENVIKILNNNELRKILTTNAFDSLSGYTVEKMSQATLNVYQSIL